MGNVGMAETARQAGEIERLAGRTEMHAQSLDGIVARLHQLSDRIQGSIPREAIDKLERGLAAAEVPAGGLVAVHGQIDRMNELTTQISEALNRLEEL